MKIVQADVFQLFEEEGDCLCVTTNGIIKKDGRAVMGAGIAKIAQEKYPGIDKVLGEKLCQGNLVYLLQEDPSICSFPTKHHFKDPSSLSLIEKSAWRLRKLTDLKEWETVLLPAPGIGLGGLSFEEVKKVIEPILDDRFVVCRLQK